MKHKINSTAHRLARCACATILVAALALPFAAHASLIFETDFSDGSNLGAGTANWNASIGTTNSLGSGSYLNVANDGTGASAYFYAANFTPASAANSWAAMNQISGTNVLLNGGADLFFRVNSITDMSKTNWFRPIDTSKGPVPTGGLRIVLSNTGSNKFTLQLLGQANAFTKSDLSMSSSITITGTYNVTLEEINHIGFTFSTDAEGWVTAKLFAQTGAGAIDTSGSSIGTATFKINSSVVTTGLTSGNFSLGGGQTDSTASNIDYDLFRLYDAAPATFAAAIPEPATATALAATVFLLLTGIMRALRFHRNAF